MDELKGPPGQKFRTFFIVLYIMTYSEIVPDTRCDIWPTTNQHLSKRKVGSRAQ